MYYRLALMLCAATVIFASCARERGPFKEVRIWKFPDRQVALAFYAAAPDQAETAVRKAADGFAERLLNDYQQVQVIILYDPAHAKNVSSKKAIENLMRGNGGSVNDFLFGGKKEGGGYLSRTRSSIAARWTFVPLRDKDAASRDRPFMK
jgi:hypothetical protein